MAPPRPIPDIKGKDAEEFERSIQKAPTKRHLEILENAIEAYKKIKVV